MQHSARCLAVLHSYVQGMLMFRNQGFRAGRTGTEVQHRWVNSPRMQWAARRLAALHSRLVSRGAEVQ